MGEWIGSQGCPKAVEDKAARVVLVGSVHIVQDSLFREQPVELQVQEARGVKTL